jgi:hypothetical protein
MAIGRKENSEALQATSRKQAFSYIKKDSVRNIFMHDFSIKKQAYEKFLKACNPRTLSLDHTFHIRYWNYIIFNNRRK